MKRELELRPLLLLSAGLIVGLVARAHPVALLVLAPFFLVGRQGWLPLAVGLAIGLVRAPTPAAPLPERSFVQGIARVVSVPDIYKDRTVADIEIGGNRLQLSTDPGRLIGMGDRLRITGVAIPVPLGSRLRVRGVVARISPVSVQVSEPGPWLFQSAERFRRSFLAFLGKTVPHHAAALGALCLNVAGPLDDGFYDDLQATGTVHIVSASGLHVMALSAALLGLLSLSPLPRPVQLGLLAGLLAFYAVVTGLEGPIVRASLVSLCGAVAYLLRRDPDGLSALAAAAVLYLLWTPADVYNPGFQLSFVIFAAFILFLTGRSNALGNWLAASLVATFAAMPLVAYHFGTVQTVSLLANGLIGWAVPILVVGSTVAFVVSPLLPATANGIMFAMAPLAQWLHFAVESCARIPFASVTVPPFSGYWLVPLYAAALLMWRVRARPSS